MASPLFRSLPLLALIFSSLGTYAQQVNPKTTKLAAREARAMANGRVLVSDGRANNINVLHQTLRLSITPSVRAISGSVLTKFTWQTSQRNTLYFDLADPLTVDSVRYHNQPLTATRPEVNLVRIDLPAASTLAYDSIQVFYHGVPPQTGFGSFVNSTHNGAPIIWTLSESYGAKDWWPCKQDLVDKIDSLDMYVDCPTGNKVGSNGVLMSVTPTTAGRQQYHWRERYPITCYLVAIAVTNFVEYSYKFRLAGDSLFYQNYMYPESNTPANRIKLATLVPVMQLFDSLFAGYPFKREKYGHAQFGWGGGEEHQTMTFLVDYDIELTAHELAHQWFGDKVTCGSWHDIWLNEGFATYLEGLSRLYTGQDAYWDDWKATTLAGVVSQPGGSVFVEDTANESLIFDGRLSYAKGAFVLHALRGYLGDTAWFHGVRNYLTDPALAYGYARTADLQRHLEASSGKSIQEFLNDYYYGQGYPTYFITYSQTSDTLSVRLTQNSSHSSVSFFENRVPLEFTFANGTTQTYYLNNTANGQVFKFPVNSQVASALYDPELWVLGKGHITAGPTEVGAQTTSAFQVVPNPARHQVRIQGLDANGPEPSVDIIDGFGRLVRHAKPGKDGQVSLSGLPAGTYTLWVIQGDLSQTVRVSLEK